MYNYDTLVFIGRFQPFHKGHKAVIEHALEQAKQVVVVLGSSFAPRNTRNPFTYEERVRMIQADFSGVDRIQFVGVPDYPYDDNKWITHIQREVERCAIKPTNQPYDLDVNKLKIGLIGHSKDETSYYLNIFNNWGSVDVPNVDDINATDVREKIFTDRTPDTAVELSERVCDVIWSLICNDRGVHLDWFELLSQEDLMIKQYKKAWEAAPYPPTFVTVDAVTVCSGHVLLVKRKEIPGKGLWAIPGGFLDQNETLRDGAIRELKEETKIKVPIPVLEGSIQAERTFDSPKRSNRGRTITTAFFINLGNESKLPKVTAADDAEKAVWVPFNKVRRDQMFEDHFGILDHFINMG